ncbi:MAG: ATP-binding cassette domain-containing protein, partial [Deltaproteobacteria bacterium]|nr:ATP-binding cassette domain-containing protein [Deltaproteobacteria bacterium]
KEKSFPLQLSGGEQQRVAIARAIVKDPLILLADEPTGNLDWDLTQEIMGLFEGVHRRGTTVLIATHSRELLETSPYRIIHLTEGKVVEDR